MPRTKQDVRHRAHIGKLFYVAIPFRFVYCEDDPTTIDHDDYDRSRTCPNLGLAQAFLKRRLPQLGPEWMGRIERGVWEDCSFEDRGYGYVQDVTFEYETEYEVHAFQRDGEVVFEQY